MSVCVCTLGEVATSRGEGTNARIKRDMKRSLKTMNLLQFVEYVEAIVLRQHEKAVDLIKSLLNKRRLWSDFVDELWRKQHDLMGPRIPSHSGDASTSDSWKVYLPALIREVNGEVVVKSMRSATATFYEDSTTPQCSCPHFTSLHLPCVHICRVLTDTNAEVFDVSFFDDVFWIILFALITNFVHFLTPQVQYLQDHWRISKHPWYSEAMAALITPFSPSMPLAQTGSIASDNGNSITTEMMARLDGHADL